MFLLWFLLINFSFRKFDWDTPVKTLLGDEWSGFGDVWRTNECCLRDLLAHKVGCELGESDFGWVCDGIDRQQLIRY